jgi:cytochrome oxidase Cu insertion factor (SCO1/SenC/PrrC family)
VIAVRSFVLGATLVMVLAVGVAAWRGYARAAERPKALTAGERAPDVRLPDQHGRPFSLAETLEQRRFVLLAFYPKAFTSG